MSQILIKTMHALFIGRCYNDMAAAVAILGTIVKRATLIIAVALLDANDCFFLASDSIHHHR